MTQDSSKGGLESADAVRAARRAIATARDILVLTGAGVSAGSGVPTFRGPSGLWKSFRPEELANPSAFRRDPRLVWEWYDWRREKVAACRPNAAHEAIARMVRRRDGWRVVTQNVDGLHESAAVEAAGGRPLSDRERPLELHGSMFRVRCTGCSRTAHLEGPVDASHERSLPHCDLCGALVRPDVVWFGEALDADVLTEAFRLASSADVCLVVGTSAVVHPAASIPLATLRAGGQVVEVNPEPTPLSDSAAITLRAPAAQAVPLVLA